MSKAIVKKILSHPDKDEIISKCLLGIATSDIHEWLKAKYSGANDAKFVIGAKSLKTFQDNYLDIYSLIQEDLNKTRAAQQQASTEDLSLTLNNLPAYKDIMLKTANEELDIRKIIKNLCVALESRLAQVFDSIMADPNNINTRIDRLLIDYAETLGNILEKYYKFTEAPADTVIQHNVTLQAVDQHISVFHDVIKEIISELDLAQSYRFMEVFNHRMSKLKPNHDEQVAASERLLEAQVLNSTINQKLNP